MSAASWVSFYDQVPVVGSCFTTVCDARLLRRLLKFLVVQAKLACACVRFAIQRMLHVTFPLWVAESRYFNAENTSKEVSSLS